MWLRCCAIQQITRGAVFELLTFAEKYAKERDRVCGGRIAFEFGAAFAHYDRLPTELDRAATAVFNRFVKFFYQCCRDAKRAVLCWLWLSRHRNVAQDIRLLIADLVWSDRAAWSERLQLEALRRPELCAAWAWAVMSTTEATELHERNQSIVAVFGLRSVCSWWRAWARTNWLRSEGGGRGTLFEHTKGSNGRVV